MIQFHPDWGTIHFIFFTQIGTEQILLELKREATGKRLLDSNFTPLSSAVKLHTPQTIEDLLMVLLDGIDCREFSTLHFLSNGNTTGDEPGILYYSNTPRPFYLSQYFETHEKKQNVVMNLASVCGQYKYNEPGFRKLLTSGPGSKEALGVSTINHCLEHLYQHAFHEINVDAFERNKTFQMHY